MLFIFEGPSKAGKSTIQGCLKYNFYKRILKEKNLDFNIPYYKPENWLFYDGYSLLGIGQKDWDDYIRFEQAVFGKINYHNKNKVFIVDRMFSQLIYAKDGMKWLHTFQHQGAYIIYITADNDVLKSRHTKDSNPDNTKKKYNEILSNFNHKIFENNSDKPIDEISVEVYNYIVEIMNGYTKC